MLDFRWAIRDPHGPHGFCLKISSPCGSTGYHLGKNHHFMETFTINWPIHSFQTHIHSSWLKSLLLMIQSQCLNGSMVQWLVVFLGCTSLHPLLGVPKRKEGRPGLGPGRQLRQSPGIVGCPRTCQRQSHLRETQLGCRSQAPLCRGIQGIQLGPSNIGTGCHSIPGINEY